MILPGIFSGKLIKLDTSSNTRAQYGPLNVPKLESPLDKATAASLGKFQYEPNGLVHLDPNKIKFLGS
jgi:hypothetical protein